MWKHNDAPKMLVECKRTIDEAKEFSKIVDELQNIIFYSADF